MQELTIEQLKFASSIEAVYCLNHHKACNDGYLGKQGYVYRDGQWREWVTSGEDAVSDPIYRFEIDFSPLDALSKDDDKEQPVKNWDESIRGPQMSGTGGNRIWKYQMPVAEEFTMKLPVGAQIIRMDGENGYLWLWAVVDSDAPTEDRHFAAYKAGGTMPDDLSNHTFVGTAHIYIQQELMLYIFEVFK